MLKQLGIVVAIVSLTTMALCQDHRFDVSIGGAYAFNRQSSGNGIDLRPGSKEKENDVCGLRLSGEMQWRPAVIFDGARVESFL